MPHVDFTKDELIAELKQIFATKEDLRGFATKSDLDQFAGKDEMRQGFEQVFSKIDSVKEMLEEDAEAESKRLDRADRRSARTQRLLVAHLAKLAAD